MGTTLSIEYSSETIQEVVSLQLSNADRKTATHTHTFKV